MRHEPLTEEQMMILQMRTVDPETSINGQPVPALTSLLFRVCDKDPDKFEEATRLLALFIEQARSDIL